MRPPSRETRSVWAYLIALCLPGLLASGCSLFGSQCEEVEHEACGGGFSDRIRVIPDRGVDGVEFGDAIEEVQNKLGSSPGLGWVDGMYRSWRMLRYDEGPHAGIEVNFLVEEDGASPGPTDMFLLQSPYRGRTKQGIGIGSSLEDVKNAYGKPDGTFGSDYVIYTYCFDGRHLNLGIEADSVTDMSLGYLNPMPDGPYSYCQ